MAAQADDTPILRDDRGLVMRKADPEDGRRKRLIWTERGEQMLWAGGEILDDIRARWSERIGDQAMSQLENGLRLIVGEGTKALDTARWLAKTSE